MYTVIGQPRLQPYALPASTEATQAVSTRPLRAILGLQCIRSISSISAAFATTVPAVPSRDSTSAFILLWSRLLCTHGVVLWPAVRGNLPGHRAASRRSHGTHKRSNGGADWYKFGVQRPRRNDWYVGSPVHHSRVVVLERQESASIIGSTICACGRMHDQLWQEGLPRAVAGDTNQCWVLLHCACFVCATMLLQSPKIFMAARLHSAEAAAQDARPQRRRSTHP